MKGVSSWTSSVMTHACRQFCRHLSRSGFLGRHHSLQRVGVSVMGRSSFWFFGSMTTRCICSCVGSSAVRSMLWNSCKSGVKANGGMDFSICVDTASGPLALSGSALSALCSNVCVRGSRDCACCCASCCRLGRGPGALSCRIFQSPPQSARR